MTVDTLPNGAVVIDPKTVQIAPIAGSSADSSPPTPAPPARRSAHSTLPNVPAISPAPTPAFSARSLSARLSPSTSSPRRSPRFSSRSSPSPGPSRVRSDPQLVRSSPYKSPSHKSKTPTREHLPRPAGGGPSTKRQLFGDALKERVNISSFPFPPNYSIKFVFHS